MLLKMQKRAIRIITCSEYNAHTDPIFDDLKFLKFESIIELEALKYMFKVVNKLLPLPLLNQFIMNTEIHDHHTRQSCDIHMTKVSKTVTHNSIMFQGPNLWSQLNDTLKITMSFESFKYKLKQDLLSSQ